MCYLQSETYNDQVFYFQDSIDRLSELVDINPDHDDVHSPETTPSM